ncbi:TolC family protein [Halobacteriovorax sp. YZS-1-1]|uniref:TolC family protein n=1 Tax=unclassified Halobacteriovorax TaxID=2639665 RepID=UPI00399AE163
MKCLYTCVLTLVLSQVVFATKSTCQIKDANEFLRLIKENHQVNLLAESTRESLAGEIESANAVYNPEFESEIVSGGSGELNSMIKVTQTFELGGKRGARESLAKNQMVLGELEIKNNKENVILENVLSLYRLRQINELIPIYKEAYESLQSLLKKKGRIKKSLSPSQEVEYETLSLAIDDYYLKLSELTAKRATLLTHLKLNAGGGCSVRLTSLPREFRFKNISMHELNLEESTEYQKNKAKLLAARSSYDLAKSNAYSDLKIGPMYEFAKADNQKDHAFGLSLSFDIPVFNTNDGPKAKALAQVKRAEFDMRYQEIDLKMDLNNWLAKYKRYKSVYQRMVSRSSLEKKHKRIETLFQRGVISTGLVIEAHRQLVDFTNRRNDYELGAVEALWNIYLLRGSILKERI